MLIDVVVVVVVVVYDRAGALNKRQGSGSPQFRRIRQPIKHVTAHTMAFRKPRVIEIIGRIVCHPEFFHQSA